MIHTHTQVTEIAASHLRKLGEEGCLEKDIRKESQKIKNRVKANVING